MKLGEITLSNITEAYFHASYAMTPRKHEIKAELIAQLRRGLLEHGCSEWKPGEPTATRDGKPVIVVTAEYLNAGHSIHRTHSRSVRSLKRQFHVVGVGRKSDFQGAALDLFDETIPFPEDVGLYEGVKTLVEAIRARKPAIVLHTSVGMRGQVIGLAALRLAPVQCLSYGHMATTHSPAMDYMVLPEDFVGDDDRFSEKLIKLPPEAMPYEPRVDIDYRAVRARVAPRPAGDVVRVAAPGTLMKLNPLFFETLGRIRSLARRPCAFTFFSGFAVDLSHAALSRAIKRHLPDATVNAELPYHVYCEALAEQDFTLSPFPYGNMNTVVESVALGLPGVCLDGAESHAHTDGALYARMGLPACLNAATIDEYVTQAVRLIDDPDWLAECRRAAAAAPLEQVLHSGDESLFCNALKKLIAP